MIQNMRSEEVSFIRSKTNEQTSDTKAQNMQRKHDFFQILSNKKSQLIGNSCRQKLSSYHF